MLISFALFAYTAVCLSVICRKMGYSPLLGLLGLIPYFGTVLLIGLLWFMAFSRWPRWPDGPSVDADVFR